MSAASDYGTRASEPDAWRDADGRVWFNLLKRRYEWPGVYDPEQEFVALYLTEQDLDTEVDR